ncbi:hypothetical protein [Pontibacter cellulosilyticus]|uniref:Uncharacterized protein n=1 Tax=Pontibacter cellulosilyticus TaxID=1720253 RepID=A0A923NB05_9BACT|nr:hypothetical protein [Pontibacter cellulosilyticus]MBC5995097.1 hypothetical protein [Pontibacter cellulosilyticus]
MAAYLHSAFYRNGEDLEFYDKEFQQLAYHIATGPHHFEYTLDNLGWRLTFTTPEYSLKVTIEYGGIFKGDGTIVTR